jgi:hypothetical protein
MNYIKRKQFLLLGSLLVILAVIPATIFLSQHSQEDRSHASASTQLYLVPSTSSSSPLQKNVGDTMSFDVMINPGANLPSVVKLVLQYDPTKFQATATPFAVNASSFPSTLEGPLVQSGMVVVSVSIGSDVTKAIQTTAKVGTLTLTAIGATTSGPTTVSFGANSEVLSVAKTDESNENVLSTTTPAYITLIGNSLPTATPVPTTAPSPVVSPSLSPSAAVSPTELPATPTLVPGTTSLNFTAFLHGIGNSGDNANPNSSSLSNKTPAHQNRNVTAYVYDDQNRLTVTKTGTITYDAAHGNFNGNVDLGTSLTDGYYTVLLKEDTHLRKTVPGIIHIIPQQSNTMPTISVVAGDVNNDNLINILDYNILIGCYSDLLPAVSCTDDQKIISDLNDDSSVNQVDYNLFLREVTVQNGN